MGRWRTAGDTWECTPEGHWIETQRLVLRPLTAHDLEPLLDVLDDEVAYWRGYPADPEERRRFAERFVACLHAEDPTGRRSEWAVCDRRSGEVVGHRSLLAFTGSPMVQGFACETGNSLKAGWRQQYYGTEELTAVLGLVADHLGYGSVLAPVRPDNDHALRLYGRCGFTVSGRRRGWVLPNGSARDVTVLRREGYALRTCRWAVRPRRF